MASLPLLPSPLGSIFSEAGGRREGQENQRSFYKTIHIIDQGVRHFQTLPGLEWLYTVSVASVDMMVSVRMECLLLEEVFSCPNASLPPTLLKYFFLDGGSLPWSCGCLSCFRDLVPHPTTISFPMQSHNPWVLLQSILYFGAFKPYRDRLH